MMSHNPYESPNSDPTTLSPSRDPATHASTRATFIVYGAVIPTTAAVVCVLVPSLAIQSSGSFLQVMAISGIVASGVVGISCWLLGSYLGIMANAVAPLALAATWGLHVTLQAETFRLYASVPSGMEFLAASLWWGSYFAVLFASFGQLHQRVHSTRTNQQSFGGAQVMLMTGFNIIVATFLIVLTGFVGYGVTFPAMADLHLPLQTIKDAARPGMGSGGYLPGSMMLYAILGTAYQAGLAWLLGTLATKLGLTSIANSDAPTA